MFFLTFLLFVKPCAKDIKGIICTPLVKGIFYFIPKRSKYERNRLLPPPLPFDSFFFGEWPWIVEKTQTWFTMNPLLLQKHLLVDTHVSAM